MEGGGVDRGVAGCVYVNIAEQVILKNSKEDRR